VNADKWERTPSGAYRIPSQDGKRAYLVTPWQCECADNRQGNRCKHQRALQMHIALRETTNTVPGPATRWHSRLTEAELFDHL
jgi:hypothetical protein